MFDLEELQSMEQSNSEGNVDSGSVKALETVSEPSLALKTSSDLKKSYNGPPILLGVVKDGENFDFCMCNPPFFETMEEAGLNPNTSCGGTPEEMVCSGGERSFISHIIEDSVKLKHTFRYLISLGEDFSFKISE